MLDTSLKNKEVRKGHWTPFLAAYFEFLVLTQTVILKIEFVLTGGVLHFVLIQFSPTCSPCGTKKVSRLLTIQLTCELSY